LRWKLIVGEPSSSHGTPTSRRAPAGDALIEERDALCPEPISLEREGLPRVTRAAAIEARLKVTLSTGDYVHVSPPAAAEFDRAPMGGGHTET
jgi:hypothetical protein